MLANPNNQGVQAAINANMPNIPQGNPVGAVNFVNLLAAGN